MSPNGPEHDQRTEHGIPALRTCSASGLCLRPAMGCCPCGLFCCSHVREATGRREGEAGSLSATCHSQSRTQEEQTEAAAALTSMPRRTTENTSLSLFLLHLRFLLLLISNFWSLMSEEREGGEERHSWLAAWTMSSQAESKPLSRGPALCLRAPSSGGARRRV